MEWREHQGRRAAFACDPRASRGRRHDEPESRNRSPFQRDRDRIIHSAAFRRLKHKTQVFVAHEGDYFRTRLTHSIEVAQIARTLSRALGLDEDLAEAVSLAHDLGHPPFGHAGEAALDAQTERWGGFDHNGQALRIVDALETRYAAFDGLNLSWETLEGLAKHNGPLTGDAAPDRPLHWSVAEVDARCDLRLDTWPSAEAQIAALSDDIAYNNHDLDDGLRAGLFDFDEIRDLAIVRPWAKEVDREHPTADPQRRAFETLRRVFGGMVDDVLAESRRRLDALDASDAEAVRRADGPVVAFSDAMIADIDALRAFLFERMYRHHRVNRMMSKAKRVVSDLFDLLSSEPNLLPSEWRPQAETDDAAARARVVSDYVSGMTDPYALEEHRQLFDTSRRML